MKNLIKKNNFIIQILLVLFTVSLIMSINVKIVLNFKPLYYKDISLLNIQDYSNLPLEEIKSNYDYVIKYVQSHSKEEFNLPSLPSSTNGKIHFEEVKNIFNKIDYLLYISIFLIIIYVVFVKNKNFKFLKWSYLTIISVHIIFLLLFFLNFDSTFTLFHKLFFNNDYWLLDSTIDPVINIMPQDFFLHCAIFIVSLNIIWGIVCYILYKNLNKQKIT